MHARFMNKGLKKEQNLEEVSDIASATAKCLRENGINDVRCLEIIILLVCIDTDTSWDNIELCFTYISLFSFILGCLSHCEFPALEK